jgi:hypothetical protein
VTAAMFRLMRGGQKKRDAEIPFHTGVLGHLHVTLHRAANLHSNEFTIPDPYVRVLSSEPPRRTHA